MSESIVYILFASQSGNAEELSYEFASRLVTRNIRCQVEDIKYVDPEELKSMSTTIFFVSTTGYGDHPDSMKSFWKFLLRKALAASTLSSCTFAVFGLGDSSYEHFNVVARKLHVRLSQLGALPLVDLALGDDQAQFGYFSAYDRWERVVLDKLLLSFANSSSNIVQPCEQITVINDKSRVLLQSQHDVWNYFSGEQVHSASVVANTRITEQTWFQDVRHITFQSISNNLVYEAGDVAVLYYNNSMDTVDRALKLLSMEHSRHNVISVVCPKNHKRRSRVFQDCSISIENALRFLLDINGIPKRSFFRALSNYTHDEELKNKLVDISSAGGTDLYIDYCVREGRSYLDIMEDFKIYSFPLQEWIKQIPIIQPRSYSIASSPRNNERNIELCVSIAQRRTPYGRTRIGLCSKYIASLQINSDVCFSIRAGKIKGTNIESILRDNVGGQVICIGTGTGVAPLRSIIQDIYLQATLPDRIGPNVKLIHGCRLEDRDDLFASEWKMLEHGKSPYGDPTFLVKAMSYHPMYSQQFLIKRYVTHYIRENGKLLVEQLMNGACIIISGSSAQMPKGVISALIEVIAQETDQDAAKAKLIVDNLQKSKSIVIDAW